MEWGQEARLTPIVRQWEQRPAVRPVYSIEKRNPERFLPAPHMRERERERELHWEIGLFQYAAFHTQRSGSVSPADLHMVLEAL